MTGATLRIIGQSVVEDSLSETHIGMMGQAVEPTVTLAQLDWVVMPAEVEILNAV